MEKTKIQLSEDELLLMQNSEWILTKNRVMEKMAKGFGAMVVKMQKRIAGLQSVDRDAIILSSPKISRGEKYLGLPYLILDYPRIFGKEDVLAIRTLFWWGHYCSITLHVKGIWQTGIITKIIALSTGPAKSGLYISWSGNEWNHDLLDVDYAELQYLSTEALKRNLPGAAFIKVAARVEITSWEMMEQRLFNLFLCLAEMIEG